MAITEEENKNLGQTIRTYLYNSFLLRLQISNSTLSQKVIDLQIFPDVCQLNKNFYLFEPLKVFIFSLTESILIIPILKSIKCSFLCFWGFCVCVSTENVKLLSDKNKLKDLRVLNSWWLFPQVYNIFLSYIWVLYCPYILSKVRMKTQYFRVHKSSKHRDI